MSFVYLDTSVALAHLLSEDVRPPEDLWSESLVGSRLLEYELWTRIHARGLTESHGALARDLLTRVAIIELARPLVERASEGFPRPVRTLDALHLASVLFLADQGQNVTLASYDRRMCQAASALEIPLFEL